LSARARVEEIAALTPLAGSSRSTLAQAAVALHHAYGAVEAALTRVARAREEGVPEVAEDLSKLERLLGELG
jgi:hypothetical protein